jgi:glycosyltransferase involved in cell wall biosynthesis
VLHVAAVPFTARKLLLPQMQHLVNCGYRVRLACAREPGGWGADLMPFDPVELSFPRQMEPRALARALATLPSVLRRIRPDILHLHSPAAALPSRLLPRMVLPANLQIVYTVHGFPNQWDAPGHRDRLLARVEKALARRADVMLFQSQEDFDQAQTRNFPTRLRLLGNGVEDHWFSIPFPKPQVPLTVLFVGRIVREKGVLDLLEAVARVPAVHLLLAGAALKSDRDNVDKEVTRRVRASDLAGRVTLLGMLSRENLQPVMARAAVIVLPSYREGVPRSVIEGLAAGRPAVVTDIRGCRELVQDGVNGYVVPPRSPEALAAGLTRLASAVPDAFHRMSAAARASVDPQRRESAVFDRLVEAYCELGVAP